MEKDKNEKSVVININENANTSSETTDKNENCVSKTIVEDVIVDLYKDVAVQPIEFTASTVIASKGPEDTKKRQPRSKHNFKVFFQQGAGGGGGNDNDEEGYEAIPDNLRKPFIIKSFLVLTLCLLITTAFAILMKLYCNQEWFKTRGGICLIVFGLVSFYVVLYIFACWPCSDQVTMSAFLLAIFVFGASILVGYIVVTVNLNAVAYAAGGTVMISVVCLILACLNFDFTKYNAYLFVSLIALFTYGVLLMIIKLATKDKMNTMTLVLLGLGLVVYGLLFVMELQMILGGRTLEMSPNNHFYAAFILYSSVVIIFVCFIQLFDTGNS